MTYCKGGERREEKVEGSDYMNLIHTTMHHHACILYILHRCTLYTVVYCTSLYTYIFIHTTHLLLYYKTKHSYIYINMFPLAGQTARPNGLTFLADTHGQLGVDIGSKNNFFQLFFKLNFFQITGNAEHFSQYQIKPFN